MAPMPPFEPPALLKRLAASASAVTGGSRDGAKRALSQLAVAAAVGGLAGGAAYAGMVAYESGMRLYEEQDTLPASGALTLADWEALEAGGDERAALRAAAYRGLAQPARARAWPILLGVAPPRASAAAAGTLEKRQAELYRELLVTRQVQVKSGDDSRATTEARIIRLDAARTRDGARAAALGLSEEAYGERIDTDAEEAAHHSAFSARVERVLTAYAASDAETGYCQGMSDLLSPFLAALPDDEAGALACFRALMCSPPAPPAARDGFATNGAGMRAMLGRLNEILARLDPHLHRALLAKGACPECLFAFRMALVHLRRELSLEGTCRLWECVWAHDRLSALDAQERADSGSPAPRADRSPEELDATTAPESLFVYVLAAVIVWRRGELLDAEGSDEVVRLFGDASRRERDAVLPQLPGLGALLKRAKRLQQRMLAPTAEEDRGDSSDSDNDMCYSG